MSVSEHDYETPVAYESPAEIHRNPAPAAPVAGPRPFVLVRHTDVSGVSGTGVVAQGVEFADGTVALRWLSDWPTSVVFHDRGMDAVRAVHGHSGATEIRYTDQEQP